VPEARTELAPDVRSPAEARAFVRRVLDAWDCDDPEEVAVLLTSEVVSNAVIHAAGGLALDVRWERGSSVVRIEVRDNDERPPLLRTPTADSAGGRGIVLVEALARRWGSEPLADGKVVWFEVPTRPLR
jgi:hypothetical protein